MYVRIYNIQYITKVCTHYITLYHIIFLPNKALVSEHCVEANSRCLRDEQFVTYRSGHGWTQNTMLGALCSHL